MLADARIPAQITVLAQYRAFACKTRKRVAGMFSQRIKRVALQQRGDTEEWLDGVICRTASQNPNVIPPGSPADGPRRAVGDRRHQRAFAKATAMRQSGCRQSPLRQKVISSVMTRPCASSVSAAAPCNGGTISAPTKGRQNHIRTISGRWWVIPLPA